MIIRGFKTKGFRFRRTFSSTSFPNLCKSMTLSHDRTESLPSQQKIGSSWTGYVFSLETRIVIQSPKIAESIFKNGRFATKSWLPNLYDRSGDSNAVSNFQQGARTEQFAVGCRVGSKPLCWKISSFPSAPKKSSLCFLSRLSPSCRMTFAHIVLAETSVMSKTT